MTKSTTMKLLATLTLAGATLAVSAAVAPAPAHARPDESVVAAEIKDAVFAPARIEVARGTTIEWTNRDPMQHSVMARDSSFDSGLLDPEGKYSRRFDAAGTYEIICGPHPFMRVTVVVQ